MNRTSCTTVVNYGDLYAGIPNCNTTSIAGNTVANDGASSTVLVAGTTVINDDNTSATLCTILINCDALYTGILNHSTSVAGRIVTNGGTISTNSYTSVTNGGSLSNCNNPYVTGITVANGDISSTALVAGTIVISSGVTSATPCITIANSGVLYAVIQNPSLLLLVPPSLMAVPLPLPYLPVPSFLMVFHERC